MAGTLVLPLEAQMGVSGRKGGGRLGGMKQTQSQYQTVSPDGVERRDHEITATGLTEVFPEGFKCEPVASPFASPYRYDGSLRRSDRNSGLHGGIDLTLKEGTPLLAVASGEVVARGEGGQMEGIFIWLRHSPLDTGLPFWIFTKYQHLSILPELREGDRIEVGQVIALSGSTGTVGGHYGSKGYPHLHLSTFYGTGSEFTVTGRYRSMVHGVEAIPDDPLVLYLHGTDRLDQVRVLPEERRKVVVGVVSEDGTVYPEGSKMVWPVRCSRR